MKVEVERCLKCTYMYKVHKQRTMDLQRIGVELKVGMEGCLSKYRAPHPHTHTHIISHRSWRIVMYVRARRTANCKVRTREMCRINMCMVGM